MVAAIFLMIFILLIMGGIMSETSRKKAIRYHARELPLTTLNWTNRELPRDPTLDEIQEWWEEQYPDPDKQIEALQTRIGQLEDMVKSRDAEVLRSNRALTSAYSDPYTYQGVSATREAIDSYSKVASKLREEARETRKVILVQEEEIAGLRNQIRALRSEDVDNPVNVITFKDNMTEEQIRLYVQTWLTQMAKTAKIPSGGTITIPKMVFKKGAGELILREWDSIPEPTEVMYTPDTIIVEDKGIYRAPDINDMMSQMKSLYDSYEDPVVMQTVTPDGYIQTETSSGKTIYDLIEDTYQRKSWMGMEE